MLLRFVLILIRNLIVNHIFALELRLGILGFLMDLFNFLWIFNYPIGVALLIPGSMIAILSLLLGILPRLIVAPCESIIMSIPILGDLIGFIYTTFMITVGLGLLATALGGLLGWLTSILWFGSYCVYFCSAPIFGFIGACIGLCLGNIVGLCSAGIIILGSLLELCLAIAICISCLLISCCLTLGCLGLLATACAICLSIFCCSALAIIICPPIACIACACSGIALTCLTCSGIALACIVCPPIACYLSLVLLRLLLAIGIASVALCCCLALASLAVLTEIGIALAVIAGFISIILLLCLSPNLTNAISMTLQTFQRILTYPIRYLITFVSGSMSWVVQRCTAILFWIGYPIVRITYGFFILLNNIDKVVLFIPRIFLSGIVDPLIIWVVHWVFSIPIVSSYVHLSDGSSDEVLHFTIIGKYNVFQYLLGAFTRTVVSTTLTIIKVVGICIDTCLNILQLPPIVADTILNQETIDKLIVVPTRHIILDWILPLLSDELISMIYACMPRELLRWSLQWSRREHLTEEEAIYETPLVGTGKRPMPTHESSFNAPT